MAFIYFQAIEALRTEYFRQINASAQRLTVEFEEGGRPALVKAIELTLSDRIDSNREVYLLLDENGHKLAGNLDALPSSLAANPDIFEANIVQNGESATGHLKVQHLPDGETLVVGHDLSEMGGIASLISQAIAAAIVLALLLVILGTYIFRQELEYRVSIIRRTTEKVGAGQLSQRIPLSPGEDEFTLLNRDINAMLDRIETLMKGARHISDTIAHNLRTPLTRIVGRLRTAQRPGSPSSDILAATQFAIDEIDSLNVLFGKLLQIAEIEAGVQRQAFRPCELDVIAADVVDMYETFAEDKGISLTCHAPRRVMIQGDPNLLASALANLVDNALKYARATVRVEVLAQAAGQACVTIQDDGSGLSSTEYGHIGRHFYRLDPASEGHGLGLTSVLAIVALHDGELVFSDAQPGLRAAVCLPASIEQRPHI
jgi:signal transduction histidine kinase